MWGHPGKKLLFMGQEFGQRAEWNHNAQLDGGSLENPFHKGVQSLVRDLNALYRAEPALHASDCDPQGFEWIDANNAEESVYAWIRKAGEDDRTIAVICNMTPVERRDWVCGLPFEGRWAEVLNTDAAAYGGGGRGNMGGVVATGEERHGRPASAAVTLPPLSTVILAHEG
jgi:1,4-alpha-glucan branching enzyme